MVDVIKLAEAVTKEIEGAELMYAPELDLKGIRELRVIVVPLGLGMRPVARGYSEDSFKVQIGLLKKATEDDRPELINKLVTLGRSFVDKWLEDATCSKVEYAPLYSPEHLRERRQFTGVIELTFKSVSPRK